MSVCVYNYVIIRIFIQGQKERMDTHQDKIGSGKLKKKSSKSKVLPRLPSIDLEASRNEHMTKSDSRSYARQESRKSYHSPTAKRGFFKSETDHTHVLAPPVYSRAISVERQENNQPHYNSNVKSRHFNSENAMVYIPNSSDA